MAVVGERNHNAKLTWVDVTEIVNMSRAGLSQSELATQYNVTQGTISNILTGRNWGHITAEMGISSHEKQYNKMTAVLVIGIVKRYFEGASQDEIAEEFNTSQPSISNILAGKHWNDVTRTLGIKPYEIKYRRLTEEEVDMIVDLRADGLTQQQIADRFGISQPSVCYILRSRK